MNIYAFGEIALTGKLDFGVENTIAQFEVSSTVGLGMEMGITAGLDLPKLSFGPNEVLKKEKQKSEDSLFSIEAEASAKGETSITFSGYRDMDANGVFVKFKADFGGMDAYVTLKVKVKTKKLGTYKTGVENKKINVLPEIPDIINQRLYIIPFTKNEK